MGYLMLIALNSLDFITGLIASKLERKAITSRKAKQGILRKCAEWAAVACAFVCEFVAGNKLPRRARGCVLVVGVRNNQHLRKPRAGGG